ncbi:MAG: apolipoprotein N-acyltransferase, partial [Sciscionella sp.]
VLLYLSFPPRSLWWLAPLAFTVLGLVLHGRRGRAGFGYGLLFGLAFFLPLVYWLEAFLGADFGSAPWLAVSLVEALFIAASVAGMAAVRRLPGAPVWMAGLYLCGEAARSRLPLNGFPWGRVGFGQPEGPLLSLASIGGAPLVGFAVVVIGLGLAQLVLRARGSGWRRLLAPALALLLPLMAGAAVWPTVGTAAQDGTLRVAVLQGNAPNIGLRLMRASAQIRANHLRQAHALAEAIRAGRVPKPDLVVWPETSTDLGPDPATDGELAAAVADIGAPALIGARQYRSDGHTTNTVLSWDPRTGPGDRYDKRELVPFAEYVPLRAIAGWFTPFVKDTGDMVAGDRPGVFTVAGTKVGTVICYEAAYDYASRDAVNAGAELLTVPTNNAWYGHSEMSYQQLGMSRLRAVEHGRAVLVSATSGVSAVVGPDGSVWQRTRLFTAANLVATVPLRHARTVADRLGAWSERALCVGGLLGLVAAVGGAVRRRARVAAAQQPTPRRAPESRAPE